MEEPENKVGVSQSGLLNLFGKLTPKALALLLGITLILLGLVILYAIKENKNIEFYKWGVRTHKEEQVIKPDLEPIKNQISQLTTRVDMIEKDIKKPVSTQDSLQNPRIIFTKLDEQLIIYGGSINTKISVDNRKEVYKLIQCSLQAINQYDGEVNGSQNLTYIAVKTFQDYYNLNNPSNQSLRPPGIFGNKTLDAIRKEYDSFISAAAPASAPG